MLELNGSFFAQLAIVLFVMTALNFLVFRPMAAYLERRRTATDNQGSDLTHLEKAREDAEASLNRRLSEERTAVMNLKGSHRGEVDRDRTAILETARIKAEAHLHKEEADLAADAATARQRLHQEADRLAEDIFAKLVGRRPTGRC